MTLREGHAGRQPRGIVAAFYGDDFTGSTDALFQFHRFGLRSTLLVAPPSPASLHAAAQTYDVIGVAGIARSLPAADIAAEIRPVFEQFATLDAALVQYKMCSTFDSSPTIGSFAPAIALAREIFGAVGVPVLPAQPEFGRYTLFANHFARAGNDIYRLDRHPTMSRHPSTPIDEADLRVYLERQTGGRVENFNLVELRGSPQAQLAQLHRLRSGEPAAIVFDAIENDDLVRIGRLLRHAANAGAQTVRRPIVALGSGGLGYGFAAAVVEEAPRAPTFAPLTAVEKLLVVSGSCAPQTSAQIEWALANGWRGVRIDPHGWLDAAAVDRDRLIAGAAAAAITELGQSRRGVVVFSALGPDDRQSAQGSSGAQLASVLGTGLGTIVRRVFEATGMRRAIVAGGDTSGFATRALGAESLEILAPLVPAGAVCRLSAPGNPRIDGTEAMLKGGQVGGRELFEVVRTGDPKAKSA